MCLYEVVIFAPNGGFPPTESLYCSTMPKAPEWRIFDKDIKTPVKYVTNGGFPLTESLYCSTMRKAPETYIFYKDIKTPVKYVTNGGFPPTESLYCSTMRNPPFCYIFDKDIKTPVPNTPLEPLVDIARLIRNVTERCLLYYLQNQNRIRGSCLRRVRLF